MLQPLQFYFDFGSPYGYFAAHLIEPIAERHGRTVDWKPILIGPVMRKTGGQPLARVPLKGDYSFRDWARMSRLHGVPFRVPDPFPVAALPAVRAFYWVQDEEGPRPAIDFAHALLAAHFAGGRDISRPEVVTAVAEARGMDGAMIARAVDDPIVKQRVKDEVESAMARGVFGSPFVIVDGEPFWGVDRLAEVDRWLETGGW